MLLRGTQLYIYCSKLHWDWFTYRTTRLIVVQIHFLAEIASTFAGIDKFTREFETESNVVRAAAPFPIAHSSNATSLMIRLWGTRLVAVIAGAGFDGALAAGTRNRVGNSGTGDGINEACFAAACKTERERKT